MPFESLVRIDSMVNGITAVVDPAIGFALVWDICYTRNPRAQWLRSKRSIALKEAAELGDALNEAAELGDVKRAEDIFEASWIILATS